MNQSKSQVLHSFDNARKSNKVCFSIINHRGQTFLDIRLWKKGHATGAFKPSSMGIRISPKHLHDVSLALQKFKCINHS